MNRVVCDSSGTKEMKIAYLCNIYPRVTHTFIRREIDGLECEGIDVLRITIRRSPDPNPTPADVDEQNRTYAILELGPVRLFGQVIRVFLSNPLAFVSTLFQALKFGARSKAGIFRHLAYFVEACPVLLHCRRERVEHVHAHFGTNAAMVALLVKRLGGPQYSIMIHGPGEWDCPEFLHLPQKIEGASFVTAISDFAKSQAYKWTSPDHWSKIHVVRCGVDKEFLEHPITDVPDVQTLIMIGRMSRSKGHTILLEAMQNIARDGLPVKVKLIGDGPLRAYVENEIAARNLGDHIEVAGWMDNNIVREELIKSRGMVLPSFGEGLPVVLMEALALGRPSITTRIAGIAELVVDGENGWLVNSGNVAELEQAIREITSTPVETLTAMGQAGRDAVKKKHDALIEAGKLAALLRQFVPSAK